MHAFLETERLTLRRFQPYDADSLVELDSDPEVMRYLTGGAATPRETIEADILPGFIASYEKFAGLGYWAAVDARTRDFVGWFALHPRDGGDPLDLEIGYRLRRTTWGRGIATEGAAALLAKGFVDFGAARVFGETYEDNAASRRVMEKLGMSLVRSFRISSSDELANRTFDAGSAPLFEGEDVEYRIDRETWEANGGSPRMPGR